MTGGAVGSDEAPQAPRSTRSSESFPPEHRLRRGSEFKAVFSDGASAAGRLLVVHLLRTALPASRLGLAVSRRVGGAVVRNRVRRRLKESFRRRVRSGLDARFGSVDVVVRALPIAAEATQAELESDFTEVAVRAARRLPRTPSPTSSDRSPDIGRT